MTLTRVPVCTVKGCPAPRDPDFHRCFVCKSDTIEHHHVQPRGMGGSKARSGPENVVALCHREHEAVTTHECSDRILDLPGKGRTYVYYDVRGKVLGERVLEAGSAAAEVSIATSKRRLHRMTTASAAASPASGESSAAEPPVRGALPGPAGDSSLVPSPTAAPPSVFDLSSWCAEGMQLVYFGIALRDGQDEVRFRIGDWYNRGEGILGEETVGYLRGFEDVTVRQYSWVAGCVAPDTRVEELSWAHHRLVAGRPPPEQKLLLAKAKDENLTTRQFNLAIHGKKPKVKRWTLEELRELVKEFDDVEAADESEYTFTPPQFLNWLEAK